MRRVRKYMGAYFMHLGGKVDAIVFSAGGLGRRDASCTWSETCSHWDAAAVSAGG